MKSSRKLSLIWWAIVILLVLGCGFAIYWSFWQVESWGWRIGILIGSWSAAMFIFMAATFALAGMANAADMRDAKQKKD